jgi:hypothetical protein
VNGRLYVYTSLYAIKTYVDIAKYRQHLDSDCLPCVLVNVDQYLANIPLNNDPKKLLLTDGAFFSTLREMFFGFYEGILCLLLVVFIFF